MGSQPIMFMIIISPQIIALEFVREVVGNVGTVMSVTVFTPKTTCSGK